MIKEKENKTNEVVEAEYFDDNNEDEEEYEEDMPNEDDLELISAEEEGADF